MQTSGKWNDADVEANVAAGVGVGVDCETIKNEMGSAVVGGRGMA